MLAHNTLNTYSRAIRFARSLSAAGWEVTVAGVAGDGLPAQERQGDIRVVRVAPSGPLGGFLHTPAGGRPASLPVRLLGAVVRVVGWPLAARAWGHGLRRLPPADLYHACGLGAGLAATMLARRARRRGRAGRLVYDYIDIFQESDPWYALPRWRRSLYRGRERPVAHVADAVVSVSSQYAADARRRFALEEPPTVVYNCPPRAEMPESDADEIRRRTGIPPERAVVLFLGRFVPRRGVLEAGDAVLRLPDAAFVAIGYGPLEGELLSRDAEPARAGRHFTLPPVPPEDVARWASSADVGVFISPGHNLNHRLMTPNKLWETLAGGTPMVVGVENIAAREIAEPEGLAVAVDPSDTPAITEALRTFLDVPAAERAERRARARRLMAQRYAWDVTAPAYLRLVERLVPPPAQHTVDR